MGIDGRHLEERSDGRDDGDAAKDLLLVPLGRLAAASASFRFFRNQDRVGIRVGARFPAVRSRGVLSVAGRR